MAVDAGWERGLDVALRVPSVLAVSGGADSMVMASLALQRSPGHVRAIASFDHGTGPIASASVALAASLAREHQVPFRSELASGLVRSEASWRAARWAFLDRVSRELGAPVATAHTEDDQVETVLIRLLRSSGVRGLAGLRATSSVQRPLLDITRGAIREHARTHHVPFLDDPSNTDLNFLRNRVRLELLPALERVEPGFRSWLLAVGERSAAWRASVSEAATAYWNPTADSAGGTVEVVRDPKRLPDEAEAALFWPEVAGRVGVALDRRGTARLAAFTTKSETGLEMPLSGGAVVHSRRASWTLRRGAG